jgi:hypothetical protein
LAQDRPDGVLFGQNMQGNSVATCNHFCTKKLAAAYCSVKGHMLYAALLLA